jgi:hypothetical protein
LLYTEPMYALQKLAMYFTFNVIIRMVQCLTFFVALLATHDVFNSFLLTHSIPSFDGAWGHYKTAHSFLILQAQLRAHHQYFCFLLLRIYVLSLKIRTTESPKLLRKRQKTNFTAKLNIFLHSRFLHRNHDSDPSNYISCHLLSNQCHMDRVTKETLD